MAEQAGSHTSKPRLPIIRVGAAILVIVAALSFAQRIRAVTHRYDDVDFAIFYGWWTDYSSGGDPWVVQSNKIDLRPGLSRPHYCNYTPFFVEIFSPVARLEQKTAFWIWEAAQMLCLVAAVLMLARANAPPLGSAPTIIVLSLVMLSRQFAGALVAAQVTPMLLALLSASWLCARRERPAAAGLCLALAALFKLYPAGAAGYFLFGRRWRALGWTIGFFAAGVMLTNPFRWIELATLELPVSYHIVAHAELTVLAFVRKCVAHFAGTTIAEAPLFAVLGFAALIDLALLAIAAAATITQPRTRRPRRSRVRAVGSACAPDVAACVDPRDPAAAALVPVRDARRMGGFPAARCSPADRVDCRQRDARSLPRDRADQGGAASGISGAAGRVPRRRADLPGADAIGFAAR